MRRKKILIPLVSVIFAFCFFSEWAIGSTVKGCVLKSSSGKERVGFSSKTPQIGIKKGKRLTKRIVSDLSIERIYLKGCAVHVIIKNVGVVGLSSRDYEHGKLVIQLKDEEGAIKRYEFFLKDVDPKRALLSKAQGEVDFDTKLYCIGRVFVKAFFEGLQQDGKRGMKHLSSSLSVSSFCKMAQKEALTRKTAAGFSLKKRALGDSARIEAQQKLGKSRFKTISKAYRSDLLYGKSKGELVKEMKSDKLRKMLPPNCGNGEFISPKHNAEYHYIVGIGNNLSVVDDKGETVYIKWFIPCNYIKDFKNFEGIIRDGILDDFSGSMNERIENHSYSFYLKGVDDGSFYLLTFVPGLWILPQYAIERFRSQKRALRYQIVVHVMDKNTGEIDSSPIATYSSGIFKLIPKTEPQPTEFSEEGPPIRGNYPVILSSFTVGGVDLLHSENFYIEENVPGSNYYGLIIRDIAFSFRTVDGRNILDVCGSPNVTLYTKLVVFKQHNIEVTNQVFYLKEDDFSYDIRGDTLILSGVKMPVNIDGPFKQAVITLRLGFCGRNNFEVPGRIIGYDEYDRDEAKPLKVHLGDIVYTRYLYAGTNRVRYYVECGRVLYGCLGLYYWDPVSNSWEYLRTGWSKSGVLKFRFPETLIKGYAGDSIKLKMKWCPRTNLSGVCTCDEDHEIDSDIRTYPFRNIVVLKPKQFETLYVGTPYTIKWISSSLAGNVKIYLCRGINLCTPQDLIATVPDTGSYLWNIANVPHWGSRRVIKIVKEGSSPVISGYSGEFNLIFPRIRIISPQGGERVVKYKSLVLLWDVDAPEDKIEPHISLYYRIKENGRWSDWRFIAQVPTEQEAYNWDIPSGEIPGEVEAQIKIVGGIRSSNPVETTSNIFIITP